MAAVKEGVNASKSSEAMHSLNLSISGENKCCICFKMAIVWTRRCFFAYPKRSGMQIWDEKDCKKEEEKRERALTRRRGFGLQRSSKFLTKVSFLLLNPLCVCARLYLRTADLFVSVCVA